MVRKTIYSSLLLFLFAYVSIASPNPELSPLQKSALTAAKTFVEVGNLETSESYTFLKNVFDENGVFVEQQWAIEGQWGALEQNRIYIMTFKIKETPSIPNNIKVVIEKTCRTTQEVTVINSDGKILQINMGAKLGILSIQYDENQNITEFLSSQYKVIEPTRKGKIFEKNKYTFKYNSNGKLISIEEFQIRGEGENVESVKEKPAKKLRFKTIEFTSTNGSRIVRTSYTESSKRLIDVSYVFNIVNDTEIQTKIDNGQNLYGTKSSEELRIVKNNLGLATKLEKVYKNEFNSFETIQTFEYDNTNRLSIAIMKETVDSKFRSHTKTKYTYDPDKKADQSSNPCNNTGTDILVQEFDVNGNLFKERLNNKERTKNVTGEWSEWKTLGY